MEEHEEPRDLAAVERFYLDVARRLPQTIRSLMWGREALRTTPFYVLLGLALGVLITLWLGAFVAFGWFLSLFFVIVLAVGAHDLFEERLQRARSAPGRPGAAGASGASSAFGGSAAAAPPVPAQPVPSEAPAPRPAWKSAPAPEEEEEAGIDKTWIAPAPEGADDERLDSLRNELEELAEHGTATALAPAPPTMNELGRWIDDVDRKLKGTLLPAPYQAARSELVASANAGEPAQCLEAGARWLRTFSRSLDASRLA